MTVNEIIAESVKLEKVCGEAKQSAYVAVKNLRECLFDTNEDDDCEKLIEALANANEAVERFIEAKKDISDALEVNYERVD